MNPEDNNQAFESMLRRQRPAASGNIEETFYQAGWNAAVASFERQSKLASAAPYRKGLFAGVRSFSFLTGSLAGAVAGILLMIGLGIWGLFGESRSNRPGTSIVQSPNSINVDEIGPENSQEKMVRTDSGGDVTLPPQIASQKKPTNNVPSFFASWFGSNNSVSFSYLLSNVSSNGSRPIGWRNGHSEIDGILDEISTSGRRDRSRWNSSVGPTQSYTTGSAKPFSAGPFNESLFDEIL